MEKQETEKGAASEETNQLNRNRSFKSKQLVRSQAIRESQSPPRTVSPSVVIDPVDVKNDVVRNNDVRNDIRNNDARNNDVRNNDVADNSSDVNSQHGGVIVKHVDVIEKELMSSRSDETISDDRGECIDDCKKQQVEIQITSGQWDEPASEQRQRTRRWLGHRQHSRDLLSHGPRVACVCGGCAPHACPHCRGRRRKHPCPTKQDSGIVYSDDCPDCSDCEPGEGREGREGGRKSTSLDVDDQTFYCRCPDRKEKPKSLSLSRTDSDDKSDPSGPELVNFIKETLNKNARDRMTLLKIERELHALVSDPGRCIVRFPVMTSYGRMLVHRCAALFQLCHHLDHTNKTCVLVSKSGTSGGRLPCTSFKSWCSTVFPAAPAPRHPAEHTHAKSILKRDTHSLDEGGAGALSASRSKSLEQREREYERVRRRIFSSDNCSQDESQWQWMNTGPIKLLTSESGRNKLLKVQSLEGASSNNNTCQNQRGAVSKSHSFGGYGRQSDPPRLLSRQGDLASSSWRLSPSSSGYRTLSLHSTDSVTPSPTGGASPEPAGAVQASVVSPQGATGAAEGGPVVWAVTNMAAVPPGALVIHPQTGRPLTNPDGSLYHFDPANPPIFDHYVTNEAKIDLSSEKKRGRLEKQHSFIDSECECRPSEECRNKGCCEFRRHDSCHRSNSEKTTIQTEQNQQQHQKPASPCKTRYDSPHEPPPNQNAAPEPSANHREAYDATTNQKQHTDPPANQRPVYEATTHNYNPSPNQRPVYEPHRFEPANQKQERFESQRPPSYEAANKFELANQRPPSELTNQRPVQLTNHGTPDVQYVAQHYPHGYTHEEMTSQAQAPLYVHQDMAQAMSQMKPMQYADANMRPMSLGVVYGGMQYPFPMYQPVIPDTHKPVSTDNTFRIDPSYPYAAMEYSQCGACDSRPRYMPPTVPSIPAQELPPTVPPVQAPAYPHHYPYQEGMQWAGGGATPKILMPELCPVIQYSGALPALYPHYNLLYPQMVPQPYPLCAPAPAPHHAANHSKRNSISGSSRNTPLQTTPDDKKVPYEDPPPRPHPHTTPPQPSQNPQISQNPQTAPQRDPNEIAAKIQQIKDQMAGVSVRDGDSGRREDRGRRNSGHGILGSYPHSQYNGRIVGRPTNDEGQLSSAARAIVNSIRNMQAKNSYHQERREYNHSTQYRGDKDREWRRRDDKERERDDRRPPLHYPRDYLLRQMSPGTWCRRSPAPLHPVLNPPRRPYPDTRNPRR